MQHAGGKGWEQVYKIRVYVAVSFDEIAEHIVRNLKERCKNHGPIMTAVRVAGLYRDMRIEIEAVADLG